MSDSRPEIKHIWFDLDGTLTIQTPEFHAAHDKLRYESYAEATHQPVSDNKSKHEFDELYRQHGSNSAVFSSLGLPSDWWQKRYNTMDETTFFKPSPEIIGTLKKLKEKVPISIFTNVKPERNLRTLDAIGVDPEWFTHIITGDDIINRKPELDGFHLMIEKSQLPPENLLYVGDRVDVDVKPAHAVGIQTALLYIRSDEADYSLPHFKDILSLLG